MCCAELEDCPLKDAETGHRNQLSCFYCPHQMTFILILYGNNFTYFQFFMTVDSVVEKYVLH